ncbi:MAG: 3-oxoacyl-[acyl-carrier-protein] reductase [Deltaproteobacteria bacterium]|nr:3-oxoacyl-[acyl-carrier-protein] reductase [Deltaproteobacteria bacterium]
MKFSHKIMLVTGGSRGIGRSIALEFARAGATVCFTYCSHVEEADRVLTELNQISNKSHVKLQLDVGQCEQVEAKLTQLGEKMGRIDILVNNAGITKDNLVLRMKTSEWEDVIRTNLNGVFYTTKVLAKRMLKQRYGRIINIASVSGLMGNPGQSNYAASKAGLIGFTKSLAKELASRNITLNVVAPGFIETEMTSYLSQEQKNEILKSIPLGRFGTCEDVANLVVFLASDRCDYVTGQVFSVNGGLYI